LFGDEFRSELELRHKLGVIWIMSLLDSLEGETRSLAEYEQNARENGLTHLLSVCQQASRFLRRVEAVLRLYSREEQLFLSGLRDQWVHSWLSKRHQPRFRVAYFGGERVVSEEFEYMAYHDLVRPFYEHPLGLDACLSPIVSRALDPELPYWRSLHAIRHRLDELQAAMLRTRV